MVTGNLILIGSLGCLKEIKNMDMILGKCKSSSFSVTYVVGTHWNCLYETIPMCTDSINEFFTISFFKTNSQPLSFIQRNEHEEI